MATNYQLKPGETADQYKARNNVNTITPPAPTNDQNNAIFNALQARLTEQAGAISSSQSNIEKSISNAMSGVREGATAESQRIESQFGRETGYARDRARSEFQNFSENRAGFATQMSAFRNLVDTTDKYMTDLAQRKEELILQNNAAAAGKIVDLEIKSLEFVQKARQDTFDNIFKSASLELSRMGEDRAGRELLATVDFNRTKLELDREQLDQNKQNAMASIAAEYGVTIEAGEDLADIVSKVAPMASAKQKKELQLLQAQIDKAYEDSNSSFSDIDLEREITAAMTTGVRGEDGTLVKMTATEAADYALQGLKNLGMKDPSKLYNKAYEFAHSKQREIELHTMTQTAKAVNEAFQNGKLLEKNKSIFEMWSKPIDWTKQVDLFGNPIE